MPMPTPSMTASRQAHPIAEFLADLKPPLMAKAPPVKKPAITGSQLAQLRQFGVATTGTPSLTVPQVPVFVRA